MQCAGLRAARSVISFTYTLSQDSVSSLKAMPGANFFAHSFIASTATPAYGPGSPHTRTVPVLADFVCAQAGSAPVAAAPPESAARSVRNLRRGDDSGSGVPLGILVFIVFSFGRACCQP